MFKQRVLLWSWINTLAVLFFAFILWFIPIFMFSCAYSKKQSGCITLCYLETTMSFGLLDSRVPSKKDCVGLETAADHNNEAAVQRMLFQREGSLLHPLFSFYWPFFFLFYSNGYLKKTIFFISSTTVNKKISFFFLTKLQKWSTWLPKLSDFGSKIFVGASISNFGYLMCFLSKNVNFNKMTINFF